MGKERNPTTVLIDKDSDTNLRTEANTGVATVLPAWHILAVLNCEESAKQRKREERELAKRRN
jgi:hypothetical protein